MKQNDPSSTTNPCDGVCLWLEQESSIMLKSVDRHGDPVELTALDARKIASSLTEMADKLDSLDRT